MEKERSKELMAGGCHEITLSVADQELILRMIYGKDAKFDTILGANDADQARCCATYGVLKAISEGRERIGNLTSYVLTCRRRAFIDDVRKMHVKRMDEQGTATYERRMISGEAPPDASSEGVIAQTASQAPSPAAGLERQEIRGLLTLIFDELANLPPDKAVLFRSVVLDGESALSAARKVYGKIPKSEEAAFQNRVACSIFRIRQHLIHKFAEVACELGVFSRSRLPHKENHVKMRRQDRG